jgi:hypothetical protein
LKDGPPKIFDPEVYPKMTSWDNNKWIIPEETKRLTDLNFIVIPKEEEQEEKRAEEQETKRRKKKEKTK